MAKAGAPPSGDMKGQLNEPTKVVFSAADNAKPFGTGAHRHAGALPLGRASRARASFWTAARLAELQSRRKSLKARSVSLV
jgi:hypothetical protein